MTGIPAETTAKVSFPQKRSASGKLNKPLIEKFANNNVQRWAKGGTENDFKST